MKERYYYNGPVKLFGQIINPNWSGQTYAVSESKAKSNLAYQYKISHNLIAGSKIELPGKITID